MCADTRSVDPLPLDSDRPPTEELTRLQAALAAAQRRAAALEDTFDNGAMAMHWMGPDGIILRANQAELDLVGYKAQEYVGRHIAEFHADQPVITDLLARLHADEVVRDYPARLRCKDGSIKSVLIDSSVYRAGGAFIHTRCFTRDVSETVQVEDELRRIEERFLLAAEATRDLIWDWDIERGKVAWAGAIRPYFGDEAFGTERGPARDHQAWASRVHPDDLAATEGAARAAFESGARTWEHEYRFARADGVYAHMFERASIVRDEGGRPVRVVGSMRDVSQRKAGEEASLRLAAIVASATDAIVGKTTDGVITSWNAAAERIFGYSEQEMVGQSIFVLVPDELHDEERDLLARVRRGERVEFSTTERFRKDGSRISVSLTVSPIWDPSGRVVGASSIKRDVTERKRAESELVAPGGAVSGAGHRFERSSSGRRIPRATSSSRSPPGRSTLGSRGRSIRASGGCSRCIPTIVNRSRPPGSRPATAARSTRAKVGSGTGPTTGIATSSRGRRRCTGPTASVREWIGTLADVEEQYLAEDRLRQADRLESVGRLGRRGGPRGEQPDDGRPGVGGLPPAPHPRRRGPRGR